MLAIIGGSGLANLANLVITHRQVMRTPYGEPSGALTFGTLKDQDVLFLARHGYGHTIPPHKVNYRANMIALRDAGATRIVSVSSVGGITDAFTPGMLVVPSQIIDYTHGRDISYFDGLEHAVMHVDFTYPYTEPLRQMILEAAKQAGISCRDGGVYGATQGPRLDTAAEIDRYEADGAEMVGMTGMPEAVLARELDLEYATIAAVVNDASGRRSSKDGVRRESVTEVSAALMDKVRNLLESVVECNVE